MKFKHSFEHYVSKILTGVFCAAFIVGGFTFLVWMFKLFARVIGVI